MHYQPKSSYVIVYQHFMAIDVRKLSMLVLIIHANRMDDAKRCPMVDSNVTVPLVLLDIAVRSI